MRFRTMEIEFFDIAKKQRFDSTRKGPRFARNRKIEFSISYGTISIKLSIWLLGSLGFERFKLVSSTNIANSNFAFSAISERPKDTRFPLNYEVAKTLQNLYEIKNFDFLRPRNIKTIDFTRI